jgi:uncharacterized paraquat-inducible protein A
MTDKELICPFCDEGALKNRTCKKCKKTFLLCDECESVYIDADSLEKEVKSNCPHCGADIS